MLRFFEHLEINFQLKELLSMNCKTNIIIIINCQLFQQPLSLVLLRIFITLSTIPKPIPTLAKAKQYRIIN